ncbi:hypothetical protein niasHT_029064 [Heterodera trifolii]|uniref:NELF-A N-terminal domain-containing protein n=1 Tax=Heterodera trifolii TaxID=157864 RepID=A0ABD2KRX3_9BILA
MASTSNGTGGGRETCLRDQDLVRWLENKLGSSELWGGRHASSMLTREMLVELETCFQELEPPTKMKIIQAMAHLSPKTLQAWKEPLLNLIELARRDPDDWVEAMADLFRNFPDLGFIQSSSRPDSYFSKTLDELEQILIKKFDNDETKDVQFPLPYDSELMNASAIEATFGPESVAINRQKHFTLKKQTNKFDKLLAVVKKAAEQQSNPANRKSHGVLMSSFPIKIRSCAKKLDNNLPMKGLSSSSNALKMSTGFTADSKKFQQRTLPKRAGGAQLLDIAELPQPNKRRRTTVTAVTTAVPSSSAAPAGAPPTAQMPTVVDEDQQKQQQNQRKGSLTNNNNKRQSSLNNNKLGATVAKSPQKTARQQRKHGAEECNNNNNDKEGDENKTTAAMPEGTNDASALLVPIPGTSSSSSYMVGTCGGGANVGLVNDGDNVGGALPPHPSAAQLCLINNNTTNEQYNNALVNQQQHQQQAAAIRPMVGSHPFPSNPSSTLMASSSSASSTSSACFNNLFAEISTEQQQLQQQQMPRMETNFNAMENEALKQFNGLLKDANKLSPLSYNMIVSFLNGNKTNPLVDKLGTLITLPLSETIEFESGFDGSLSATSTTASVFLVETFFQMNYCTGEWKRLRKSRLLKPEELGKYSHYLQQQGTSSRLF